MDCPVCKKAMITFELEQVEVDHCTSCGGIWLDAGELEILLGDSAEAKKLLASFKVDNKCREKKRKCPICLKKMEKILAGLAESALLLDRCPKGDGLWFDKGELKDVLRGGSFDKENKIVNILTAIFAD
ncbi:MAG: zf-TFIIB domain-containing protein [Planctomycetota bacterium]|jgi:Zn-finger nucleic acid-binding protein